MREATARMALVALSTLAVYGLVLTAISQTPGVDIRMPLPAVWVAAFAVAVVFSAWNLWDSLLDTRAAFKGGRSRRVIAGGLWRLRSDALQGACCTAMAGAGALAIVQWGSPEIRTALILAAAVLLVANQVWNRYDRERVMRMPSAENDARQLERLAAEIASDAREGFHEVGNTLQHPVAVLDLLRTRPGITPGEVEEIDDAIGALTDLAVHVRLLHERVRALDPSLRRPQP